jgi:hypothetical protein
VNSAAIISVFISMSMCVALGGSVDLADPANRGWFLSHPVIGDVSYDAFVRAASNPIYVGKPPYEWPVNGFLFRDPADGDLYCYIGLYPKGYWPAGPARAMRSSDQGRSWRDLGIVLRGDPNSFDGDGKQGGAVPDVSVVADSDGYHMVYDWAKPDNSDGGLGYAFAKSPAGPWVRDPKPIHAESIQPLIPPGYKRVYAGSLVRRKHDWLVVASMSTPRNAGGTWATICLTAPTQHGPWSAPIFLHKPQDGMWGPEPVEFFPAFTHGGYVYANHTSVAANRGYQIIRRAPVEEAHRPEVWTVWQAGSLFHAEPIRSESHGIWGQAFHGCIDPAGVFRIMYPARNPEGVGTINIASRPWDQPFQRGFWLSGPNAPSLGLVQRSYRDFKLEIELQASGPWRLIWNHRGPLGPDRATSEARIFPLTWRDCMSLSVTGQRVAVEYTGAAGHGGKLVDRAVANRFDHPTILRVSQEGREVQIKLGDFATSQEVGDTGGAIGLVAEQGTCIHVKRFQIEGEGEALSPFWLSLEGLLNAASTQAKWTGRQRCFRFGFGYAAAFEDARAKWNFEGTQVSLWSPRGPDYGKAQLMLDGRGVAELDLQAAADEESRVVWKSPELKPGRHALMLLRVSGELPVDCVEVRGDGRLR